MQVADISEVDRFRAGSDCKNSRLVIIPDDVQFVHTTSGLQHLDRLTFLRSVASWFRSEKEENNFRLFFVY